MGVRYTMNNNMRLTFPAVAFSAGFLFGLITMLIQYVGLFMTGLHTGLFVAIAGLAAYDYLCEKTHHTVSGHQLTVDLPLSSLYIRMQKLCMRKRVIYTCTNFTTKEKKYVIFRWRLIVFFFKCFSCKKIKPTFL